MTVEKNKGGPEGWARAREEWARAWRRIAECRLPSTRDGGTRWITAPSVVGALACLPVKSRPRAMWYSRRARTRRHAACEVGARQCVVASACASRMCCGLRAAGAFRGLENGREGETIEPQKRVETENRLPCYQLNINAKIRPCNLVSHMHITVKSRDTHAGTPTRCRGARCDRTNPTPTRQRHHCSAWGV